MYDAAAAKGFPATTIGDVVERAEVSRRTFYEHFTGKEDCFLAAFDFAVADVGARLGVTLGDVPQEDWRARIRLSWRAFLGALAAAPAATWALYIETFSAGPELIERTTAVNDGFAAMFRELHRRARDRDPAIVEIAPEVFSLYIGGTAERIRHCLRTRGAAALPELEDLFAETAFHLFGKSAADS
ncbi:TetR/AcrR family transcriptional regulator [Actinokineospora xionganensis]|uniref:TetR/AcrR family transcriptional regulator n=1 Tax=Actinokineospora xionganensis TaxID=2684470 RepID=A0ABR7L586_9PSEU|nr:TetR/AcrR family transcriptional regulator [Actinokineospora xionganensis]MBC6447561.1 TetR/AcrR family transcriptional regulator [Actinokineospora xionganensis]